MFNIRQYKYVRGFTLLEVMVVVAIISIMSITVVIGFNTFGQSIRVEETGGVIGDVIHKLELEVSQNEYQESRLYFEKDFLRVESEQENSSLKLKYKGMGTEGCKAEEIALEILTNGKVVYMKKKDLKGNNLQLKPFKTDGIECVTFLNSKETGLEYETYSESEHSNTLRFFHFNLNRSDLNDPVQIITGTDYMLKIQAPYGKKQVYKNDLESGEAISLILKNEQGSEKELTLKN